MKFFAVLLFISMTSFGASPRSFEAPLPSQPAAVSGVGASNTRGTGMKFGIEDILIDHLVNEAPEANAALGQQRVLVSLDYFFPTNFNDFYIAKGEEDAKVKLEKAVDKQMDLLASRFARLIIVKLPQYKHIAEEFWQDPENGETRKSFYNLAKSIDSDSNLDRARTVNDRLEYHLKRLEGRLILVPYDRAYHNLAVLEGLNPFQSDHIHLNLHGQAFAINTFLLPALRQITKSNIPDLSIVDGIPLDRVEKTAASRGIVMASFVKSDFRESAFRKGTEELTSAQDTTDLKYLDKAIRERFEGSEGSGFPIRVISPDHLELDLSNLVYFTKTPAYANAKSGVYRAYGSDYWGVALGIFRGNSPLYVNYRFQVTKFASDRLKIKWDLIPAVDLGGRKQKIEKERIAEQKDPNVIREIEEHIDRYDHLEFEFEMTLSRSGQ